MKPKIGKHKDTQSSLTPLNAEGSALIRGGRLGVGETVLVTSQERPSQVVSLCARIALISPTNMIAKRQHSIATALKVYLIGSTFLDLP